MEKFFFDGWESILRTLVIGVLAYISLIILLRVSGNRTLSKMNAFDLIVTVALGSTLANVLLNKDIALVEGVIAFALLIGLQYAVTWSSVRARGVRRLVTGDPRILLYRGEFLPEDMLIARVTRNEVRAAIRSAGLSDTDEVQAVILETDGSFNVIQNGQSHSGSAMADVVGGPQAFHQGGD